MQARWNAIVAKALASPPVITWVDEVDFATPEHSGRWNRWHPSGENEILHVLGGRVRLFVRGRARPVVLSRGDTAFLRHRAIHRDVSVGDCQGLFVQFSWPSARDLLRRLAVPATPVDTERARTHLRRLFREFQEEFLSGPATSGDRMQEILCEILLYLHRQVVRPAAPATSGLAPVRHRRLAGQIRDYLLAHHAEALSLESVTKSLGASQFHACRVFSQAFGTSMTEMLADIRMERAAQYLGDPALSIKQVAAGIGMTDANYFGKVFRRYSGYSPSQYRMMVTRNT